MTNFTPLAFLIIPLLVMVIFAMTAPSVTAEILNGLPTQSPINITNHGQDEGDWNWNCNHPYDSNGAPELLQDCPKSWIDNNNNTNR